MHDLRKRQPRELYGAQLFVSRSLTHRSLVFPLPSYNLAGPHTAGGRAPMAASAETAPRRRKQMWVVFSANEARVIATLTDIIVPRASGFWRVGVSTVCDFA